MRKPGGQKGVRKVRTAGGSRYYGLPIGSPITADDIKRAKDKHGGAAAPTAERAAAQQPVAAGKAAQGAPGARALEPINHGLGKNGLAKKPASPHPTAISQASGVPATQAHKVNVGGFPYDIPKDVSLHPDPTGGENVYAISPDETVRLLTPHGIRDLNEDMQDEVLDRVYPGNAGPDGADKASRPEPTEGQKVSDLMDRAKADDKDALSELEALGDLRYDPETKSVLPKEKPKYDADDPLGLKTPEGRAAAAARVAEADIRIKEREVAEAKAAAEKRKKDDATWEDEVPDLSEIGRGDSLRIDGEVYNKVGANEWMPRGSNRKYTDDRMSAELDVAESAQYKSFTQHQADSTTPGEKVDVAEARAASKKSAANAEEVATAGAESAKKEAALKEKRLREAGISTSSEGTSVTVGAPDDKEPRIFTKTGPNAWTEADPHTGEPMGEPIPYTEMAAHGDVKAVGFGQPLPLRPPPPTESPKTTPPTGKEMIAAPVGSVINVKERGADKVHTWTKTKPSDWTNQDGKRLSTADLFEYPSGMESMSTASWGHPAEPTPEEAAAAKKEALKAEVEARTAAIVAEAARVRASRPPSPVKKDKGPTDKSKPMGRGNWDPTSMGRSVVEPRGDEIAALHASPYSAMHVDEHGHFTAERAALHDKIIEEFLDGLEAQQNPIQYMNGGGPGSGKSGMAAAVNAPPTRLVNDETGELEDPTDKKGNPLKQNAALIDPDALKMQLPEVKAARARIAAGEGTDADRLADMGWAGNSHEESGQLARRLHQAALERGFNVIYDGTGNGKVDTVKERVMRAKDLGFRVEANYMYLEPQTGIERADLRAARIHRVVPEDVIVSTYAKLPAIFDALKEAGLLDSINLYDNNVPYKTPVKHIATGDGTKEGFKILDTQAFMNFMSTGARADITPFRETASEVHAEHAAIEPEITATMQELADANGATLEGLDSRLKSKDSLVRKMLSDSKLKNKPARETAAEVSDALRYTMQVEPEKYTETIDKVLEEFRQRGYGVRAKNAWNQPDNPYQGVNVALTSPDGSKTTELQFHTADSLDVRENQNREPYGQWRDLAETDPKAIELKKQMMANSAAIPVPDGIEDWDPGAPTLPTPPTGWRATPGGLSGQQMLPGGEATHTLPDFTAPEKGSPEWGEQRKAVRLDESKVSPEAAAGFKQYTGNSGPINQGLRNGTVPEEMQAWIPAMDAALVPTPTDRVTYRGINPKTLEGLKPGDVFRDKAYLSTASRSEAEDWSNTVLQIEAPAGTPMGQIDAFNWRGYEDETLLPRDLPLTIISDTTYTNGYRTVVVRVVKETP